MKHDLKIIILATVFVLLFAFLSSFLGQDDRYNPSEGPQGSWACAADFLVCPDGTEVWRTAPYCLFAPCPGGE